MRRGLHLLLLTQLAACSALYPFNEFSFAPDAGPPTEDLPSASDASDAALDAFDASMPDVSADVSLPDVTVDAPDASADSTPTDTALPDVTVDVPLADVPPMDAPDAPRDVASDTPVDITADRPDVLGDVSGDVSACRLSDQILCRGVCVNPLTDRTNCGVCGRICPQGCANGTCLTVESIQTSNSLTDHSGHTCALMSDRTVRCWGSNDAGQLGDNSTLDRARPTVVIGLSNVLQIAVGAFHSCARRLDGTVACWGSNNSRETGSMAASAVLSATTVTGISNAIWVSAGYNHTCAAISDGTVRCWGSNTVGQCGTMEVRDLLPPTNVSGVVQATEVSAGNRFTCARSRDGTVRCWGAGESGQLGDGLARSRYTPMVVPALMAQHVLAGGEDAVALYPSGVAVCWGANRYGLCANGLSGVTPSPSETTYRGSVTSLSVGSFHACYLGTVGLECAGLNSNGQLGNGTTTPRTGLGSVPLNSSEAPSSVSCGYETTCLVLTSGEARCWGRNAQGQLGDGTTTSRSLPTPVLF